MLEERLDGLEERDGTLESGMVRGMNESFARLDVLLARPASR
jgi:hypothetical protein